MLIIRALNRTDSGSAVPIEVNDPTHWTEQDVREFLYTLQRLQGGGVKAQGLRQTDAGIVIEVDDGAHAGHEGVTGRAGVARAHDVRVAGTPQGKDRATHGSRREARTRASIRALPQRAPLAAWLNCAKRGRTVCFSNVVLPMEALDRAILDTLLEDILTPAAISAVVDRVLALIAPGAAGARTHAAGRRTHAAGRRAAAVGGSHREGR